MPTILDSYWLLNTKSTPNGVLFLWSAKKNKSALSLLSYILLYVPCIYRNGVNPSPPDYRKINSGMEIPPEIRNCRAWLL